MKTTAVALLAVALLAGGAARPAAPPIPDFDHVVVVVFENKESRCVIGNPDAPTFNLYSRLYARMTQSYGVTHPSLPNYLALVSGSTWGITTNCVKCSVNARSLADTIEASGRSWKTYAEGLPRAGFLGSSSGRYAKKHNPFAYFRPITANTERAQRLVPLRELATDFAANDLPDFAFVVPDLCHSMHDCPVSAGDAWLRRTVGPLLQLPNMAISSPSTRAGPAFAVVDTSRRSRSVRPSANVQASGRSRTTTGSYGRSSRRGDCPSSAARRRRGRSPESGGRGISPCGWNGSAPCWPLSPQRKPRVIPPPLRIAPV